MKKLVSILIVLSAIMQMPCVQAKEQPLKIYVSQEAEAGGDGSLEHPYATLNEARDAIREIKANGAYPAGGISVNVRQGNYFITEGFNLTEEDSGADGAPITWCVYPGEEVKLIGGAEIKLGECQPVTDSRILSKIKYPVEGKIYEIDLKAKGIDGYGDLYVTGHASYYTKLYGLTKGDLPTPSIYYNGEYMNLAQYPNLGEYMLVDKRVKDGLTAKKWYAMADDPSRPDKPEPSVFSVNDDHIANWGDAKDAWVFGYWQYDWSDQTMSVAKIDPEKKTIEPGDPNYYTITPGQRCYIYNLIEEMDVPGEWYYDKNSGKLYLYPLDNNPESSMILSFSENPIIKLENVKNVVIRDFEVTGTRNCGIYAKSCENLKLCYLAVDKLSGEGIIAGGKNVRVEGCSIFETGKKGIDIKGGDQKTLTPCNNVVFNNCIHDFAKLVTTYEGGVRYFHSVGITVKNNLIYNSPHLAINPGGNDNICEYNEIHSVLKEASDMGAIYADFGMTQRGNIFRYNLIHDCESDTSQSNKVQAIYLDNSSSGSTVYGNIIYNIKGDGVFLNGGRDNTVTHNIFANVESGVRLTASGRNVSWGWYQNWLDGKRTFGLIGDDILPYESELYSKYPHMNGILDDDPPSPKYNIITENVAYKSEKCYDIDPQSNYGTGLVESDMYEMSEIDEGLSTAKDIGFINISKNNFGLKDDSAVYEKYEDFEKIDVSRMGLVTSQLKGLLSKDAVALAIDKPISYVNWERKLIDDTNVEVVPFIENDRTYVPARFLSEALGASVEWTDGKAYIDLGGETMVFTPDSSEVEYQGAVIDVEAPLIIRNDRIFVPLRAVSELYGKKVFWDNCGLVIVSGADLTDVMNEDRIYDLYNRM